MKTKFLRRLVVACVAALACAATVAVAGASAASEVAYDNTNTVPAKVNGLTNEDTYSQPYFGGFNATGGFGGQIETAATDNRVLKSVTTQLDVFACEHGEYQYENCTTLKPTKKFSQEWVLNIFEVGPGNEPGALVASATLNAKLHYRPSTNVTCPATIEGKGFGANCDVGGLLQTITFKKFTQAKPLPLDDIVTVTNKCEACSGKVVNVGIQVSYKEYNLTKAAEEPSNPDAGFVAEPAEDGGIPAVGSDPLPSSVYEFNKFVASGWTGEQPVFKIETK